MHGAEVALYSAAILTTAAGMFVWLRLRSLSLIDAFLIGVALYFGAYTVVDYFVAEETRADSVLVAYVFASIWLSAFAFWLYAKFGHQWVLRETSFARLEADWISAPGATISIVILAVVGLRFYTAAEVGSLGDVTRAELSELRRELPYWHTSLAILAPSAIFAAGLAAYAKSAVARGFHRLFWLSLAGMSALLCLGVGRRAFIAFLVVAGISALNRAFAQGRRMRAFLMLALALPVLVVASNVYQVYRAMTFQGVPVASVLDIEERESLVDDAIEIESTLANLENRRAIWLHNYELVEALPSAKLQYGDLFFSEIANYIPAVFWPGKETVDTETEMLRAFGLAEYDRPNNIWAFTLGDFGDLGMLVTPLMVLLFVYVVALVLTRIADPFLRTMVMGFVLFYALNIEGGYAAPLQIARDLLLIGTIYYAAVVAVRCGKWLNPTGQHA